MPPMQKTATYLGVATATLALLAALALLASSASAATFPGHPVGKHGSSTGHSPRRPRRPTSSHPNGIWVRATGRNRRHRRGRELQPRGSNASSNLIKRSRAGIYRIPPMPHANTCSVVASGSGSGRIGLEVRAA